MGDDEDGRARPEANMKHLSAKGFSVDHLPRPAQAHSFLAQKSTAFPLLFSQSVPKKGKEDMRADLPEY